MKKILCALLACLMLATPILTGCDDDKKSNTTTVATTTENPQEDNSEPVVLGPEDAKYDSITIGGVDLSEFKIVYAPDSFAEAFVRYQAEFNSITEKGVPLGDTHYARMIAEELAVVLKNMTGIELEVVPATETSEHEILIGTTGHTTAETDRVNAQIAIDVFKITMVENGTKLWITGGSSAAMYHALDGWYREMAAQNTKNVSFAADYAVAAQTDVITVSCIGDSITDGYGSKDSAYFAWPEVLQRHLWKDFVVTNFGVSGTTMRTDHKDAYITCWKYSSMISAAPNADINIIMLGTNDSDRFKNWDADDTDKYIEDYTAFVDHLTELNPDTKFIMMNCPEYYGGNGGKDGEFGSDRMIKIQKELFEAYKEEGRAVSFFDMHTYTATDLGVALYPDKLHPGDIGYAMMGKRMSEMLNAYVNGTEDALLTK